MKLTLGNALLGLILFALLEQACLAQTGMPGKSDMSNKMPGRTSAMPGMKMSGMEKSDMDKKMPDMDMKMPGMDMKMSGMNMKMSGMDKNASNGSGPGLDSFKNSDQPASDALPAAVGRIEFNQNAPPSLVPPRSGIPMALPELIKLAETNNPTLIQAKEQIAGEKGKAIQAGLWPNPAASYIGELLGANGKPLGEFTGGQAQQEIILGGKLRLSRKKYLARMSAAEFEAQAQAWRVSNDVAMAYYQVLGSQGILHMEEQLLKTARDMWLTTNELFNVGQANQADLQSGRITLEKQLLAVQAAENRLAFHWQMLSTIVGIDDPHRPLEGELYVDIPVLNWEAALNNLLQNSPQLAQAKAKLHSDFITVRREKRQPIPNLVIAGGAGYSQLEHSATGRAMVAVTNIPLFDRNQGTIMQAEADLRRQQAEIRLLQLRLRQRLADQYQHYLTALQHVQSYRTVIVPAAQKRYELRLQSYQNTRQDWPETLEAQKEFFMVRNEYIAHLVSWRQSVVELNGFVLTGGLTPPPGITPPGHIDATPKPR